MNDKKHWGRFTLQFKPANPQHLKVIELLESKGRRKAKFIVEAVLCFIGETQKQENPIDINCDMLKSMVSEIVREYMKQDSADSNIPLANKTAVPEESIPPDINDNPALDIEDTDADLLAAVRESMASFRDGD